jgi:hypothetical protein
MMASLTGEDLYAYLRMMRQTDPRLVLLVEGAEDCVVLDPHLNDSHIQSVPGYGKLSVLRAAEILEAAGDSTVLCLVDSDLDEVVGRPMAPSNNLISTDHHDMVADLFFAIPEIFSRLVWTFGDRNKVKQFMTDFGLTPLQAVVKVTTPVGALRACSIQHGLGLNMSKYPMTEVIDMWNSDTFDAVVVSVGVTRSPHTSVTETQALQLLQTQVAAAPPTTMYCSGHDLISSSAAFISRLWGGSAGTRHLGQSFRAAVGCESIQSTGFFKKIRLWSLALGFEPWTCATS